jgi:hypothetical protein
LQEGFRRFFVDVSRKGNADCIEKEKQERIAPVSLVQDYFQNNIYNADNGKENAATQFKNRHFTLTIPILIGVDQTLHSKYRRKYKRKTSLPYVR